jgi:ribonuclease R
MKKNRKKDYSQALREEFEAFFAVNHSRAFTAEEILGHYDVENPNEQDFYIAIIEELVQQGIVGKNAQGQYLQKADKDVFVGKFDHVNPRYGFVRVDASQPDVFVDEDGLNGAMDGDLVKITLLGPKYRRGENPEGRIIEILQRGREEIVGKIKVSANYALVTPDARRIYGDILIAKEHINEAQTGEKVIVKLLEFATDFTEMTGEVIEVLGKAGENNAEMHAIMAEFGLPVKFPKTIDDEADAISEAISEEEIAKRRDFRQVPTFTIDPVDAKDFDDAISFKTLENGNFEIGVHIADVSHYVRPGSLLEEEAYKRATSVYLVDRCIPMLPEKLSNKLCSLRPNEDKLTFSAVFEIGFDGKIHAEWFGKTIIHSIRRFSYEEAQEVLETKEGDYASELEILNAIAKTIRRERFKSGAINFETNEVKFTLDEKGVPIGLHVKVRKDAHKLIEEYMLLANKKVAEYIYTKAPELPMVYRIHDSPDPDKLKQFADFAMRLGYKVNVTAGGSQISKSLNQFMTDVEGKPEQGVLENLAIRSMAKARYTTEPKGHFGLAFEHYSHFTSPIRRYPDVMTHRVIEAFLNKDKSPNRADFELKSKHSSEREKLASEAERASIKYKQVEYMSLQTTRQVHNGIVTGVTDFGIFVEMEGTGCEGLVRMPDLNDDYYDFDQKQIRMVGRRTGKIISFGDALQVRVKATDLAKRAIDLEMVLPPGRSGDRYIPQPSRGRREGVIPAKKVQKKFRR